MAAEPTGIVRVVAADGEGTAGTGFLVGHEGLVATCTHVLESALRQDGRVELVFHEIGSAGGGERGLAAHSSAYVYPRSIGHHHQHTRTRHGDQRAAMQLQPAIYL